MIRAFVCTWSGQAGGHITTPIGRYLEDNEIGFPVVASNHWPDADQDGVPDKPLVLVIVWQPSGVRNAQGQNIEALGNLQGVYMLPAYRFGAPVADIPTTVRGELLTRLEQRGVPRATFAGVEVYGDFLRRLARYFSVDFRGFGRHVEVDADGEFA